MRGGTALRAFNMSNRSVAQVIASPCVANGGRKAASLVLDFWIPRTLQEIADERL
jgi:hypothetical protein